MKRRDGITYTQINGGRSDVIEQIKIIVFLTVTGCILLALETTCLGRISLSALGMGRAAPSLGLLFCMAAGFLFGERIGGGFGIFMGFLVDSADHSRDTSVIMLFPLIYFLFGYLSGVVGKRRLARNLPSFTVFAIVGGALECLIGVAGAAIQVGGLVPIEWIWQGLVPVWILTILFSPVVYGILWGERWLISRKK